MATDGGVLDRSNQKEVPAMAPIELPIALEKQGVAGLEFDVAETTGNALALAGDRKHRRVVEMAEAALADRLAGDRGVRRHDRFEHLPAVAG